MNPAGDRRIDFVFRACFICNSSPALLQKIARSISIHRMQRDIEKCTRSPFSRAMARDCHVSARIVCRVPYTAVSLARAVGVTCFLVAKGGNKAVIPRLKIPLLPNLLSRPPTAIGKVDKSKWKFCCTADSRVTCGGTARHAFLLPSPIKDLLFYTLHGNRCLSAPVCATVDVC